MSMKARSRRGGVGAGMVVGEQSFVETPSFAHTPSLFYSHIPKPTHSFTPSFTPSLLHPFTPSLLDFFTSSLLHTLALTQRTRAWTLATNREWLAVVDKLLPSSLVLLVLAHGNDGTPTLHHTGADNV